ncbi:unnamed protein product [Auanema sp. JU1783]|nr:unnamed protein product [Auanema sp. JU1783]
MICFLSALLLCKTVFACLSNGLAGSCGCTTCPCGQTPYMAPVAYPASSPSFSAFSVQQQPSYIQTHQDRTVDYSLNSPIAYAKSQEGYGAPPPIPSASAPSSSYIPAPTFVMSPHLTQHQTSHQKQSDQHPKDTPVAIAPAEYEVTSRMTDEQTETYTVVSTKPVFGYSMAPMTQTSGYSAGGQIQVSSSNHVSEKDEYLAVFREEPSSGQTNKNFVTYYNQECTGFILGKSSGETIDSATRKCALLGCSAANAMAEGNGSYQVEFLRDVKGRQNKKYHYCMSLGTVPLRSIRNTKSEEDKNEPVRQLRATIFRNKH